MTDTLDRLLEEVRKCDACAGVLPLGPRPVLRCRPEARILIAGQAPGTRVHATGIPWDDPSGVRLRQWLAVSEATFYDDRQFAIIPIGLCYPGRGKSGDLPPRKECAELWFERLHHALPNIELTLTIGQYAQRHYLGEGCHGSLTETVRHWHSYLPNYLPLPHPSPRNNLWLRRNPWFERDIVPALRTRIAAR